MFNAEEAKLILRRKFDMEGLKEQLRTVFKAGTWFARNHVGGWFFCNREMNEATTSGYWDAGVYMSESFNIEFPDVPWRESKFQI